MPNPLLHQAEELAADVVRLDAVADTFEELAQRALARDEAARGQTLLTERRQRCVHAMERRAQLVALLHDHPHVAVAPPH